MNEVVSFRLSEEEKEVIDSIADEEGRDKSDVARELIKYGETYRSIRKYRKGEISVGQMASELDIKLQEAMDLLADLGVNADISLDDQLQAEQNLKENW
ncbi:MAG: ribbon-helix-helix protein, CopG family [Candidatus Nanohaloarchaea archaeon]